jgi:thiol-disulfide isomerase/thioredoxin
MNRVLITIGAIIIATIILLKLSVRPQDDSPRRVFNSSFSFSSSETNNTVDRHLLTSLEDDYSFLSEDSLQGNTLVVSFWEPNSEQSIQALPYLNTIAEKNRNKKVIFIAATSVPESEAKTFFKRNKIALACKQIYGEAALKVFNQMINPATLSGVLPVNLIINSQSEIVYMQEGFSENEIKVFDRYLESQLMR